MISIHPNLIRAYREAKYVVEITDPITLLVGKCNSNLSILLKERKLSTAAFITAFNPNSNILSDHENIEAHKQLLKDAKDLNLETIDGYGQDITEQWPRETSALILGITESQAETLADKYSQNAFIWIGSIDALPVLRLRHPIALPSDEEIKMWLLDLPSIFVNNAKTLSRLDQAWIMSVTKFEQFHWLDSGAWDLNQTWPLSKPDGSAMGIGTELDRVFKLIAAGQSKIVHD